VSLDEPDLPKTTTGSAAGNVLSRFNVTYMFSLFYLVSEQQLSLSIKYFVSDLQLNMQSKIFSST